MMDKGSIGSPLPAGGLRSRRGTLAAGALMLLALAVGPAGAGEWHVDGTAANEIEFTSEVIALTFSGVSDKVDGYFYWEGGKPFEREGQVYFEVDVRSLDTGIGKRDRDMRDVLGAKKWPMATYKARVVGVAADTAGAGFRVRTKGAFSLHGVERELEIDGLVRREGEALIATSEFTVRLTDHQIEAPSLAAFVKVSDEVAVRVEIHLKEAGEDGK